MTEKREKRKQDQRPSDRERSEDSAAPPDAAGHRGSFTRPSEVESIHDEKGSKPVPPLHRDTTQDDEDVEDR